MAPMDAAVPGTLVWGHAALAVCAALYLAWWWTFFNPALPKATGALYAMGVGFILGAVAFGIAAVVLLAMGLGALAGVVALVTAANLVCYVLYFRLPPVPSFIDGAAPLAVVGVLSAVLAVVIARL